MRAAHARRSNHSTVYLVIATLVALGAVALWAATGSGGAAQAADDDVAEGADADASEALADEVETVSVTTTLPTIDVVLGRDPFQTIRPEPVAEPASQTQPTGSSGSTGSPTGGETGSGNEGACRSTGEAVCEGTVVVLREIRDGEAVIQVDGESFVVRPGEEFGGGKFQLLRITDANCAEIVYRSGDVSEVFSQCIGGSTLK